jgi:hypothetical protein
MLEQYRLRVSDPDNIFAPYISSYDNLLAAGRFNKSSHRRHIAAVIHFGHWFAAQGQPVVVWHLIVRMRPFIQGLAFKWVFLTSRGTPSIER